MALETKISSSPALMEFPFLFHQIAFLGDRLQGKGKYIFTLLLLIWINRQAFPEDFSLMRNCCGILCATDCNRILGGGKYPTNQEKSIFLSKLVEFIRRYNARCLGGKLKYFV